MSETGKTQHRGTKPRKSKEKKKHLVLSSQIKKKKYSRPVDDDTLDNISDWMTTLDVKPLGWTPTGTWDGSQPKKYHKYEPLLGTDVEKSGEMFNVTTTRVQCITTMKQYDDMSLEELRLGDHIAGFRYNEFPSGATLFKQATPDSSEIAKHWPLTGTRDLKFCPTKGDDEETDNEMTQIIPTDIQCITAMPEYEKKSFEELRFEDYMAGMNTKKRFGSGSSEQSYWSESLPDYLIANWNDVVKKFQPKRGCVYEEISKSSENGMEIISETPVIGKEMKIQSITADQTISFEELRLKDYLSGRKAPKGPHFQASPEDLINSDIHIDMDVNILIKIRGNEVREKGIVKFIGRVPKQAFGELHAGIELNRPVGDCDGFYQGVPLFQTKPYHAKVVPLSVVVPQKVFAEMFGEPDEQNEEASGNVMDSEVEAKKCVICMTNRVEIHLSPCGHVCCCDGCSKRVTSCPVCRGSINRRSKAYLP